jgi:hypothetical protein
MRDQQGSVRAVIRRTVFLLVPILLCLAAAAGSAPRCFGAASRDPEHQCVNHALDHSVTPDPDVAVIQPSAPCTVIRRTKPNVCAFGPDDVEPTVALIGDSHARHWGAALAAWARRDHWRGAIMYRTRCPFRLAPKPGHKCIGWVKRDLRWLREHPRVETVFVSADAASGVSGPPEDAEQNKIDGFQRAWAAAPASVKRIYVLHDVPHASPDTNPCVKRALKHDRNPGTTCARPREEALIHDPQAAAAEQDTSGRVHLIDLTDFMCDATQCFPVVGGALVIKDVGHLTRTFSTTLGRYIRRAVTRTETR